MKRIVQARWAVIVTLAATALTSCNKGYGCPTNFDLNDSLLETVVSVLNVLL
jgi:hypothetical protein